MAVQTPTTSVLMAVRNGAAYVAEAIESVQAQTLADLELVVVDDGSTDDTATILARFAREDERIRVLSRSGEGQGRALNHAAGNAAGRYLAVLDADDVALPDRLALQVPFLDAHPAVAVVGGAALMIDARGRQFAFDRCPEAPAAALRSLAAGRSPIFHSAATIRAEAFRAVAGYRGALDPAEDFDLWLRLSEHGEVANVAEPVVRYRVHPDQISIRDPTIAATAAAAALATAAARREGRLDPLDGGAALTPEVLARLDVRPAEIVDLELDRTLWLARTLARAGYREEADALWARASARAPEASSPRFARRQLRRSRDAVADRSGQPLRLLVARGRALAGRALGRV